MRFSQNFLFLAPNRSHLPVAWYTRLRIGAIFRLWHQNWCHFRERDFCCGIKIDAILSTSSLIPSRRSHLARVIFKKLFSLLIPSGKWRNWRCFSKIFSLIYSQCAKPFIKVFLKKLQKFCCCAVIRLLPLHLLHVWKRFCEPPHLFPVGKAVF